MSRVRVSKQGVVFPSGYVTPVWLRAVLVAGRRSRRVRRMVMEMPPSRLRSHLLGRFFRQVVEDFGKGAFDRFIPMVHPNADEVQLFDLSAYTGRDGWETALREWLEMFPENEWEMGEFIDPGGGQFALVYRWTGRGVGSGAAVQIDQATFVVALERGMATRGRFYLEKAEALEAVGLRE